MFSYDTRNPRNTPAWMALVIGAVVLIVAILSAGFIRTLWVAGRAVREQAKTSAAGARADEIYAGLNRAYPFTVPNPNEPAAIIVPRVEIWLKVRAAAVKVQADYEGRFRELGKNIKSSAVTDADRMAGYTLLKAYQGEVIRTVSDRLQQGEMSLIEFQYWSGVVAATQKAQGILLMPPAGRRELLLNEIARVERVQTAQWPTAAARSAYLHVIHDHLRRLDGGWTAAQAAVLDENLHFDELRNRDIDLALAPWVDRMAAGVEIDRALSADPAF